MNSTTDLFKPDRDINMLSEKVMQILRKSTPLAWAIFNKQCSMYGFDAAQLTIDQLSKVSKILADAVARFTSPQKGEQTLQLLKKLIRTG